MRSQRLFGYCCVSLNTRPKEVERRGSEEKTPKSNRLLTELNACLRRDKYDIRTKRAGVSRAVSVCLSTRRGWPEILRNHTMSAHGPGVRVKIYKNQPNQTEPKVGMFLRFLTIS